MRNARLDEAQTGIKIAGRNINNLRYATGTTFIAESQEELKSLLMKVKEESKKVGFPLEEIFSLLYCCSVSQSCLTICDLMDCSTPGCRLLSFTITQSMLKLMAMESVMPSNHLILCPLLLLLPSIFPSIRVFSNESAVLIRWPKYWSFSFSISPSNEYSGLISFRIDWFELFAVQGTLKSLLQHHSSKASFFKCWAFFMVELSHLHMTTGKNSFDYTDLSQKCNVSAFYYSSRFVIAFLPRNKHLLIPWLQSPYAVIFEPPPQIKSVTVSINFPIYLPWIDGTSCHDVSFLKVVF